MKQLGAFLFACGVVVLGSGCRPPGIPFVNGPSLSWRGVTGPSFAPPAPPQPPAAPVPVGLPQPPSPW